MTNPVLPIKYKKKKQSLTDSHYKELARKVTTIFRLKNKILKQI